MANDFDQARSIAERIARRVSLETHSTQDASGATLEMTSELAAMRASLLDLQKRLSQIESKVRSTPANQSADIENRAPVASLRTHSPWLGGVNSPAMHASQERFGVEEATVSELVDFFQNEKRCSMEPGGKPCDHCAMCNTRGF